MKNDILLILGLGVETMQQFKIILLVLLVILVGVFGVVFFNKDAVSNFMQSEQEVVHQELELKGFLYFGASDPDVDFLALNTYVHDFQTGDITVLPMDSNYYEFAPIDKTRALFMTTGDATTSEGDQRDLLFPAIFDFTDQSYIGLRTVPGYNERDLVASDDGQYVAFAQQQMSDPAVDNASIENWQIVISETESGSSLIIENAVAPQWIHGNEDLLFLREDGVYAYNLPLNLETKVYDEYQNFNAYAEMTLSPSAETIVVTMPSWESSVLVLKVEEGAQGMRIAGVRGSSDGRLVSVSPVISPDSQHYALLVIDKKDVNVKPYIEIRSFESNDVVLKIPIDVFSADYLKLSAWSDSYMPMTSMEGLKNYSK